jgi:hypothetical protein
MASCYDDLLTMSWQQHFIFPVLSQLIDYGILREGAP